MYFLLDLVGLPASHSLAVELTCDQFLPNVVHPSRVIQSRMRSIAYIHEALRTIPREQRRWSLLRWVGSNVHRIRRDLFEMYGYSSHLLGLDNLRLFSVEEFPRAFQEDQNNSASDGSEGSGDAGDSEKPEDS